MVPEGMEGASQVPWKDSERPVASLILGGLDSHVLDATVRARLSPEARECVSLHIRNHAYIYIYTHYMVSFRLLASCGRADEYLSIYLPTHLPTYLSIHPSIHPPIHPSTHPLIKPSTHPPIHPSIYLIYLSIYLPIYLSV